MFTVFIPDIMLIDGKEFHGSNSYVEKHNILGTIAVSSSWFRVQTYPFSCHTDLSETPIPFL